MNEYNEGTKYSKFNAGVAQTERIHGLQIAINAAKFNPILKNMETGTFNYEIMIVSADCLVAEGWDKFTSDEQNLMSRMNTIIKNLNKYYPPILVNDNGIKINKINYEKLLNFFELYERKIKELYGKHKLNAPSTDEDDDYDY